MWGNYWRNYWASRKRKKNSAIQNVVEGTVVSDLAFRRAAAFFIDYFILCLVFFLICLCGMILAILQAEPISPEAMNKIFEIDIMITFVFVCLFILWLYFFLLDYFEDIDVGKN